LARGPSQRRDWRAFESTLSDQIILDSVKKSLTEIEKELLKNNVLNENRKIIFKIVKPLLERIPLSRTNEIVN
jgi:hypothetical protein